MPEWFNDILDYELQSAPPEVLRLLPAEQVRENLSAGISRAVEMMLDIESLARYQQVCPFEGATTNDYGNKLIELDGSRKFIAEINFEGLNITKPFVDIEYSNFDVLQSIDEVADAATSSYRIFSPARISFVGVPGLAAYQSDLTVYAALLGDLKALPAPPNFERVTLHPEFDLAIYPEYSAIYSRIRERTPDHPSSQESERSLERVIKDGALFSIIVDGEWAGVFGVRKERQRFLNGYCVIEEVLKEEYRGQRLGAALQRRAIDAIDAPPETVFFGQIDAKNPASYRTAMTCGRRAVYSSYWYQLP